LLKKSDEQIRAGKDDGMTIRNPFKKKSEKKAPAPVRPTPPLRTYGDPLAVVSDPPPYTPPPAKPDDCGTGASSGHGSSHGHSSGHSSHSSDFGGHSSHTHFDSGSHSFGGHDSGSSGCDSGGGF
jgi:hypothetical protein